MKLPLADRASIPRQKLTEYLLSPTHPVGRFKARFYFRFGFSRESWRDLESAIRRHAVEQDVIEVERTTHGTKYLVGGPMPAPDGRAPWVITVWIVAVGEEVPRLVTAFPQRESRYDPRA